MFLLSLPAPAALAASTTQPATRPIESRVDEAVGRLSSDDWKMREAAQEELVRLGDDALPRLRNALKNSHDPEALPRMNAALTSIERNSFQLPTRVSLHFHGAKPQAVFDALSAQSGIKLGVWPEMMWQQINAKPVNVDLDGVTYWTAMRAVCGQTGVMLVQMGERYPQIQRGDANWAAAPCVEYGPFLVVATDVCKSQAIALSKPKNVNRGFGLTVVIFPELKVRVNQRGYNLKIESAVDENGVSLGAMDSGSEIMNRASGQFPFQYSVAFDPARATGKRIANLKGSARIQIISRVGRIVFEDPLNKPNVTQTVEGRRVTLNSFKKRSDGLYAAEVTQFRDKLDKQLWDAGCQMNLAETIHFIDAAGEHALWNPSSSYDGQQFHSLLSIHADAKGGSEPAKGQVPRLEWEFIAETRDVSIPFELHDIPIPN